jgi:thiol-disulfide isomerase/thioredoxin
MSNLDLKLCILILVATLPSCKQNNVLLSPTITKIKFNLNTEGKDLFFWYYDKFGDKHFPRIHDSLEYTAVIKTVHPSIYYFGSNNEIHQPIFLSPNSTITFSKSGDRHIVETSKNHCNALLLEQLELNAGFSHTTIYFDKKNVHEENSILLTKERVYHNINILKGDIFLLKEHKKFIKKFNDTCHIDKIIRKNTIKTFENSYKLKTIVRLLQMDQDSLYVIKKIKKIERNLKRGMRNKLNNSQFLDYNAQRLVYFYNKRLCSSYLGKDNEFEQLWKSSELNFKGYTKEFIQFTLLKKFAYQKTAEYDNYYTKFVTTAKDRDFIKYLEQLTKKGNNKFSTEELTTILFDKTNNEVDFSSILKHYQGKKILIDFWASWCVPCRKEMLEYPKIEAELKKNNVIPIFLSIDENKEAWVKAIPDTKTSEYDHYSVQKNTHFARFFDLSTIPRYILIDERGNVKNFDVVRPSDVENFIKSIQ